MSVTSKRRGEISRITTMPKLSMLDILFFGSKAIPSVTRTANGRAIFVRQKPKKHSSSKDTMTSTGKHTGGKKVSSKSHNAANSDAAWTSAHDDQLIEMKKQNKSWAEIEEALKDQGMDRPALKAKYRELLAEGKAHVTKSSDDQAEKKGDDVAKGGILKKEKSNDEGNKASSKYPHETGQQTHLEGRPVIVIGPNEPLNAEHFHYLIKENERYDRRRWLWLKSRIFDKTGIRVEEEYLEKKFVNVMKKVD